jgi:hypothetical protein
MPQIARKQNTDRAQVSLARHVITKTNEPGDLALTGFEPGVGLVDDVNTTLATDNLVVAMALHQTLEGIADFHGLHLYGVQQGNPLKCLNSGRNIVTPLQPVNQPCTHTENHAGNTAK